ncbi:MAG: hypothetical protein R3178_03725 [Rhodothermales bacterium]|nr:hypothetical protein [Rhodothermales bacterium]
MRNLLFPVGILVVSVHTVTAEVRERPVAVSPGARDRVVRVADPCPTFSWSGVPGAEGFEFVVYEYAEGGEVKTGNTREILRVELPGSATSWSPALSQCVEPERRYGWSVRARYRLEIGEWSDPRLFTVSAGSLERAVERVLRRLLSENMKAAVAGGEVGSTLDPRPLARPILGEVARSAARNEGNTTFVAGTEAALIAELGTSSGTPTHGVEGLTHSSEEGSAGVAGASTSATGVSHGVWGESGSADGYAGYFANLNSTHTSAAGVVGGTGIYTSAGRFNAPDLVLGRNDCGGGGNDGRLWSDPICSSSDLFFESNSSVTVTLDRDGSSSGDVFRVYHGGVGAVLTVEDDGDLTATGSMTSNGNSVLTTATGSPIGHHHFAETWAGSAAMGGAGLRVSIDNGSGTGGPDEPSALWGDAPATDPSPSNSLNAIGVKGTAVDGTGVRGESTGGVGVWGESGDATAVYGTSAGFAGGVFVHTDGGIGVRTVTDGADIQMAGFSSSGKNGRITATADDHTDMELFSNDNVLVVLDSDFNSSGEFQVYAEGTAGTDLVFKVDESGDVYADGGYHCGNAFNASPDPESFIAPCLEDSMPADFAEMLPAADDGLEPGDVLAIDENGRLARSTRAMQSNVAGVFSSRPSFLGNSRHAGSAGFAPLAIVGIVPVKVTDEGGAIRPGDLLISSPTAGHAMRGGEGIPNGAVIGKALESLGTESGQIQMLVVLQ